MPGHWQIRKKIATPFGWLMLLLLLNGLMNADTHQSATSRHPILHQTDDIDSVTEWLVEWLSDGEFMIMETGTDDQDEDGPTKAKYKFGGEFLTHLSFQTLPALNGPMQQADFRLQPLSDGVQPEIGRPPDRAIC